LSREQLKEVEPELAMAREAKENFLDFDVNDYFKRLKGVQKEIMEDYDHGYYGVVYGTPEHRRSGNDLRPYIKSIQDGDTGLTFPDMEPVVGDIDADVIAAQYKKEIQIRLAQGGDQQKENPKAVESAKEPAKEHGKGH